MLNSKQRAALRKEANSLQPVFQIGKGEIDEQLIQSTIDCLAARELIKLKVLETSMYNAKEAAQALAEATESESVQVIGNKFVLYKQKEKDSAYIDILNALDKNIKVKKPKVAPKPTDVPKKYGSKLRYERKPRHTDKLRKNAKPNK